MLYWENMKIILKNKTYIVLLFSAYTVVNHSMEDDRKNINFMKDILERAQAKMNLVNDPKVWQSNNAGLLKERLVELSDKFPKFTDALNVFTLFLDDVVAKNIEDDAKDAKEQDQVVV